MENSIIFPGNSKTFLFALNTAGFIGTPFKAEVVNELFKNTKFLVKLAVL